MRRTIAAALSGLAATAAAASIPQSHHVKLPTPRKAGEIVYLSGGMGPEQANALQRAARKYPLEVVFVEKSGKRERHLADMPVRITGEDGRVVFDGLSEGPYFLARLPKGRYIVSTRWDAWCPSRPVKIGGERQRVVFAWSKPSASVTG